MAKISIADLFADTDSFLTELSGTDLQVAGGGGHKGGYGYGKKGRGGSGSGSDSGRKGRGGSGSDSGSGRKGRGGHGHKCW